MKNSSSRKKRWNLQKMSNSQVSNSQVVKLRKFTRVSPKANKKSSLYLTNRHLSLRFQMLKSILNSKTQVSIMKRKRSGRRWLMDGIWIIHKVEGKTFQHSRKKGSTRGTRLKLRSKHRVEQDWRNARGERICFHQETKKLNKLTFKSQETKMLNKRTFKLWSRIKTWVIQSLKKLLKQHVIIKNGKILEA